MASAEATRRAIDNILTIETRNSFWELVTQAQITVFGITEEVALAATARFRDAMETVNVERQILLFHEEPLTVAAGLHGISVKTGHLILYARLRETQQEGGVPSGRSGAISKERRRDVER